MQINIDGNSLKRLVNENPGMMMAAGAGLLSGAAKLLNANTNRKNAKTWRREVVRREKKR